jgi:hypothetical protein
VASDRRALLRCDAAAPAGRGAGETVS